MLHPAEQSDFKAIRAAWQDAALDPLHKARTIDGWLDVQLSGFLVSGAPSRREFEANHDKYVVSKKEGKLQGFLRLDDDHELDPEADVFWISPREYRPLYEAEPHASIGVLAVAGHKTRQGVAAEMLCEAEARARARGASYLFSFVVLCPVPNYSSMFFHTKNGFKTMAVTRPQVLFGIHDYQSTLYGKELS